jgi:hypothetical protein
MKKMIALAALLTISLSALAVDMGQVAYVGGTVSGLKEGTLGRLDTAQEAVLIFEHSGGKVAIPFAKIDSYEYKEERARRMGVLPTIAVGMFKRLQRRHFFRISYHDDADTSQVTVFEVPKDMPHTLLAVLQTRAPRECKGSAEHAAFTNAAISCDKPKTKD